MTELGMTRSQMIYLITSNLTATPLDYHSLWRKCGSPQHPDNALFDDVLLSLTKEGIIKRKPILDICGAEVWGYYG